MSSLVPSLPRRRIKCDVTLRARIRLGRLALSRLVPSLLCLLAWCELAWGRGSTMSCVGFNLRVNISAWAIHWTTEAFILLNVNICHPIFQWTIFQHFQPSEVMTLSIYICRRLMVATDICRICYFLYAVVQCTLHIMVTSLVSINQFRCFVDLSRKTT